MYTCYLEKKKPRIFILKNWLKKTTTTATMFLQNPYQPSTSLNLDDVSTFLSHKYDSDDEVSAASSTPYHDSLQWGFCEHWLCCCCSPVPRTIAATTISDMKLYFTMKVMRLKGVAVTVNRVAEMSRISVVTVTEIISDRLSSESGRCVSYY